MNRAVTSRTFSAAGAAWLLAVALSATAMAGADDNQTANYATPAPANGSFPAQPAPSGDAPGFLHQLQEWWHDGFGSFNSKMQQARDKFDDVSRQQNQATQDALSNAAQATKDAAAAVAKLPSTRMFELHDRCLPARNGAPDCQTAANNACHGRGFAGGNPLSVSTAQVCSPAALLAGRRPGPADCHDETYLLGVACQ